ncbi:nodulation protein NodH [Cereibacter sphaeroides]|uniref:nodulation protein NodH n=1 Tax=Cereibacter sphaeroides TaxID=1063 RepID=UPI002D805328|nr:nodulation protein NodH [Cereibacter sphaeroides]
MFDSFVMLAGMRTGSNFLEANLNALPGVRCHGELFNPHFIGSKDCTALFGHDLTRREADPLGFLARVRAETRGLSGFRYFHDHDPRVLPAVMEDHRCAKIVLTRNPAESYVSLKIARETGQWKLTDATRLRAATVVFDAAEFEAHLEAAQTFQMQVMRGLQLSGQTAFYLDYEDLSEVEVLNGLARFLGVDGRLSAIDGTLKKQNPQPIRDKVANPDEMAASLARLDRFNLSRTPNFEPRRGAGVPGFVAGGPLLYMPVRGGPEGAVRRWLEGFGGPLVEEFSQKTLRQWKKARPGHRSFTVLRHPLARAHAGFRDQILTGRLPEIRQALNRIHKLDLPPPDAAGAMEAAAFREAFLGFLRFLRLNLSGQTGLRVSAHFASQGNVLQGMAQIQVPDLVVREERMGEALAYLAAEAGCEAPPVAPEADAGPHPLASIWGRDLEDAARDAYARDYATFGFGCWRA